MKKDTEHSNPWRTEKHFKEDLCILDRFNCGVAFPGDWFHDNFFKLHGLLKCHSYER